MDYMTADIGINPGALVVVGAGLQWNQKRKMVDKWMAVRLVAKNLGTYHKIIPKKLVTLHEATTDKRKTFR